MSVEYVVTMFDVNSWSLPKVNKPHFAWSLVVHKTTKIYTYENGLS